VVRPVGDGHEVVVRTLDAAGAPVVHARATAGWVDAGNGTRHDLAAARERCDLGEHDGRAWADGLLTFGPRWSSVRRVRRGRGEELAELVAGDDVAAELGALGVHPALLDEALSFGTAPGADGGSYLPLGYDRLVLRGPLTARAYAHLRHRDGSSPDVLVADLTLSDEAGRELLAVEGFTLRRVEGDPLGGGPAEPPAPAATGEVGIRPADGAEALRRLLAADVGPQVVVSAVPLDQIAAEVRRATVEAVEEEVAEVAAGALAAVDRAALGDYVAPRGDLEASLATLWGEVLGVTGVGVEDDFFELGGSSLVAVQLIWQVGAVLGDKLPMRSLFEAPTVAGMALAIEELRAAGPAPDDEFEIEALPRGAG
jgi:acyl carrier protein